MKHLSQFLKSQKKKIILIILASLIQVFGTLMVPYLVAQVIDTGIVGRNVSAVVSIGLQMLEVVAITALISLWNSYLCADMAALAGKYLRERIFSKTQILSIRQFNDFGTASMITRATGDITIIQEVVIMVTQMVLPAPLTLTTAVIMTAIVSPSLVYIPLSAILVFFAVIYILFRKASPISATIQKRVDTINRIVRESIIGIRVIRAFDNTEYERNRSNDAFVEYANNVIRLNRVFAAFSPAVWSTMGIAMAAVAWFGGYFVLQGDIQIGSITAVSEYTVLMLLSLIMLAMVLVMIPRMTVCLKRIQEVLDIAPGITDAVVAQGQLDTNNPAKIVFQDVSFSYRGAEKPVLEGLNFVCEQGKTTAIIGGTGSGKSTIAALMLRLYDIQGGKIMLEGKDIRTIIQRELRERISYVPQKAFLFSGTIADNLRIGNMSATLTELQHAAQIAQVDSFIDYLEAGYDSPVAQAGTNLSGGQKQRLCIARALVKKAPVYIFDDCFSALDFKTDAALRSNLKCELQDAAVVIIAQRISTTMDADQIIVLSAGRITGIGKHDELMRTSNVYKEIAFSQLTDEEMRQA